MRICPECAQGKCGNCDGTAWDDTTDAPAPCLCDDHAHVRIGLTQTPLDDHLENLRAAYQSAATALTAAVTDACPGDHQAVQHRDGRPPWCPRCGRDRLGVRQSTEITIL